jgi:hypothetical protein
MTVTCQVDRGKARSRVFVRVSRKVTSKPPLPASARHGGHLGKLTPATDLGNPLCQFSRFLPCDYVFKSLDFVSQHSGLVTEHLQEQLRRMLGAAACKMVDLLPA